MVLRNPAHRRTGPGPFALVVLVLASAWWLDVFVARPLLSWLLP